MFSDKGVSHEDGEVLAWGRPADIFTEDLIYNLYGMEVKMESLYYDQARVSIPKGIVEKILSTGFALIQKKEEKSREGKKFR